MPLTEKASLYGIEVTVYDLFRYVVPGLLALYLFFPIFLTEIWNLMSVMDKIFVIFLLGVILDVTKIHYFPLLKYSYLHKKRELHKKIKSMFPNNNTDTIVQIFLMTQESGSFTRLHRQYGFAVMMYKIIIVLLFFIMASTVVIILQSLFDVILLADHILCLLLPLTIIIFIIFLSSIRLAESRFNKYKLNWLYLLHERKEDIEKKASGIENFLNKGG